MNRRYRNQKPGYLARCRLPGSFCQGLLRLPRDGILSLARDKLIRMPRDETTDPFDGNFTRMPRDETAWLCRKVFTRLPRDETARVNRKVFIRMPRDETMSLLHSRLSRMPRDETVRSYMTRAARMPRDETLTNFSRISAAFAGVFKGDPLYWILRMHVHEHHRVMIRGKTRFRWRRSRLVNRLFRPVMGELHSIWNPAM